MYSINKGIISTGDNATNTINHLELGSGDIPWEQIEGELSVLKQNTELESVREFAEQVAPAVKERNPGKLATCAKSLGTFGVELLAKSSAPVLAELMKKLLNLS